MRKLAVAIMLGLGVMVSGCGHSDMQVNNVQQEQQVQKTDGISLGKAIDLAKNNKFTPQNIKFEGDVTKKVFGDEPEIIVTTTYNMGGQYKFVNIHVTDPEVIKRVAKLQEERKNNFVHGTGNMKANEIVITNNFIEVM